MRRSANLSAPTRSAPFRPPARAGARRRRTRSRRVRQRRRFGRYRRHDRRLAPPARSLRPTPPLRPARPRRRAGDCNATLEAGTLTIATGDPAFPPYVIDDAPGDRPRLRGRRGARRRQGDGLRGRRRDVGAHHVRRGDPARPEELRLQPPAVLRSRPSARRTSTFSCPLLHEQPGDGRARRLASRRSPPPSPTSRT